MSSESAVCILMATYNGSKWLTEQLHSLAEQGLPIRVVISDDMSTDDTLNIANTFAPLEINILPTFSCRFGNANRNFLRLICEADIKDAMYISLCDQDDIWGNRKLKVAIEKINSLGLDVYSSNVTAFWENGLKRDLNKAGPQKRWDYIFESAGPGCTFVFTRKFFNELRTWALKNRSSLNELAVHDWWIYAYGRTHNWKWHIDSESNMLYRQHDSNEVGANIGISAAIKRMALMRSGAYRSKILDLAKALHIDVPVIFHLRNFNLFNRLWLMFNARHFRRRSSEAILLLFFFLLMKRNK